MTETDIKNIAEIKAFLDENEVPYGTEYGNFCIWHGDPSNRRTYEIEYVPSWKFPISYPKY